MGATDQNDTIHLGLCMAGAVSAGAYTAGVMDYLLETLERWETAKKAGNENVPQHNIIIDVMAGASAGGMTAAIAAAAMQCDYPHVNFDNYRDEAVTKENKLFNSWVNLTGKEDMLEGLLKTDDIKAFSKEPSGRAASFLNSSFIDAIATDVLLHAKCNTKRPYISPNLDVWLALSNINGIRHDLNFHTIPGRPGKPEDAPAAIRGDAAYISHNYRDFVHFRITENDVPAFIQKVNFAEDLKEGHTLLRDAAMATGAFPLGLTARALKRPRNLMIQNPLYKLLYGFYVNDELIRKDNTYIISDGGMMNNEPFEVTRTLLQLAATGDRDLSRLVKLLSEEGEKEREKLSVKFKEISKGNADDFSKEELHAAIKKTEDLRIKTWDQSGHDHFTRTVLLIDPFPGNADSDDDSTAERKTSRTQITQVLKGLFNAATGQLLFKTDDIEEALDTDNYSRFIMVPKRRVPAGNAEINAMGSDAIACGAMGGFSGFFCREYRVHDYLLGRRNCQRFLQERFMVPANTSNPIFLAGYKNEAARKAFTNIINGKAYLPILPDIDPVTFSLNNKTEHTIFWPNRQNLGGGFDAEICLKGHRTALAKRLAAVMKDVIFRQMEMKGLPAQYAALPFRWPIRNIISKKIIEYITEKTAKHHLL